MGCCDYPEPLLPYPVWHLVMYMALVEHLSWAYPKVAATGAERHMCAGPAVPCVPLAAGPHRLWLTSCQHLRCVLRQYFVSVHMSICGRPAR